MSEWQPIETAPLLAGTRVLLAMRDGEVLLGQIMSHSPRWCIDYDGEPLPPMDVTHWMPLPEPPK